jgi:alpha-mannosidase
MFPSTESIIRQVLFGQRFFEKEFGTESAEYMLPDCFGFPASLPSVLAHCGMRGFSTAKLTWGSAVGIPFNVGVWEGPDGESVIAALNPGKYDSRLEENLSLSDKWRERIDRNGQRSGVYADYLYYGVGDRGVHLKNLQFSGLRRALHPTGRCA